MSAPVTLHHGDCLDVLRGLPDASVDSVVTDPPYGLGFMGQKWDTYANETGRAKSAGATFDHIGGNHNPSNAADAARTRRVESRKFGAWCEEWTAECFRVLKPGGHLLAFGGTRTWHRLACAVEDAGFEVRDSLAWLYGSGFPKSLDVSKAIDKAAGAERMTSGERGNTQCPHLDRGEACPGHDDAGQSMSGPTVHRLPTAPATPDAARWQGWGTALKPAFEPVVVARKPLAGTVAGNVLAHGTGALNIDGCRVGRKEGDRTEYGRGNHLPHANTTASLGKFAEVTPYEPHTAGRWPANVVLDESQAAALDEQSGEQRDGTAVNRNKDPHAEKPHEVYGGGWMNGDLPDRTYGGSGGASRFFYVAKAGADERVRVNGTAHPTVKPLSLMRWLVRLVTPPGGTVLEPFAGSGTTVEAALVEGFHCIAIEREADYLPLIEARIARRRDPIKAVELSGEDRGLFDLLEGDTA